MLLTVLCQLSPLLQHYMQKQNYSPPYIKRHVQLLNFIIVRAPILDWDTFEDVIHWFENESYTERYLKDVKMVLFNIEFFHEHGCFPGNGTIKRELLFQTPSLGSLDMTYLQEHLDELISYMNEHDYSESCIRRLRFVANRIIVLSRTIEWNSYQEILTWYSSQNHKYFYIKGIRGVLGILEAFHNRNEMPTNRGTQNTLCPVFSNYSILNPNFRYLVDLSIELSLKRGLKASTINSLKAVVSTFFVSMQKAGASQLENISPVMINSYLAPYIEKKSGRGIVSRLRTFFDTILPFYTESTRILNTLPILHYGRKNVQYLTEVESSAFRDALRDPDNGLTYKCRAIGTILFYTGIRRSDVVNLTFDSVDLKRGIIRIHQQKTGQYLELPLLPVVGNAIYDYCVNERPICEETYLFVGTYAPHRKNDVNAVVHAIESIMKVANIRQNQGDRQGSHIFRHRAATEMMSNNTSPAVVSHTLGHSSPDSLDPYLHADKVHLRECALSISEYPLAEEVFEHV